MQDEKKSVEITLSTTALASYFFRSRENSCKIITRILRGSDRYWWLSNHDPSGAMLAGVDSDLKKIALSRHWTGLAQNYLVSFKKVHCNIFSKLELRRPKKYKVIHALQSSLLWSLKDLAIKYRLKNNTQFYLAIQWSKCNFFRPDFLVVVLIQ